MRIQPSFCAQRIAALKVLLALFFISFLQLGCTSLGNSNGPNYTEIKPDMSAETLASLAISEGGPTFVQVRKSVIQRKLTKEMEAHMHKWLLKEGGSANSRELVLALQLYQMCAPRQPDKVVAQLLTSENQVTRQLGWQLAATFPSRAMATVLEEILSKALLSGNEQQHIIPEMAKAASHNSLTQSYSLVREGLMRLGHEDFAEAMAELRPQEASSDFMTYLAKAQVEELRQIHINAVNALASTVIFRHFQRFPPPVSHPNFSHLFFYAISMNTGLSEMARTTIGLYLPKYSDTLALDLAKLPVWVQIAYIEGVRREGQPKSNLMLSHLKEITDQQDVADEIREFAE